MNIIVDKDAAMPLYWQISDQIKEMILASQLTDGVVLPSERVLAKRLGVHRNTVIKAYGRLKDEELIDSFQGVGYRVTYGKTAGGENPLKGKVNWSALIKDEYQNMEVTFDDFFQHIAEGGNISLSTGIPALVYDEETVAADLAEILANEHEESFYLTPYQGDLVLRQRIVEFLRGKGIRANTGQVQVLSETNQALDFIVAAMLKPGDKVLIEEPVSPDVYRVIELSGCETITVPMDENGMICDHLEALIEMHRPKFIYVNSSFHDPTGIVLSTQRRKRLVELASQYRIPIIEEDAASELAFDGEFLPSIKAMDMHENVIYIYSFSLTFIPGLSMAFVVGPEKLMKSLSYLVSIRMMSLDWMVQKLLAKYLGNGVYDENLKLIKERNRENCDLMCRRLEPLTDIGVRFQRPKGGIYVWCRLPGGVDCRQVVNLCRKKGVALMPGTIFFPKKNQGQQYLRLNYSYETAERIEAGMDVLAETLQSLTKNV